MTETEPIVRQLVEIATALNSAAWALEEIGKREAAGNRILERIANALEGGNGD